LVPRLLTRRCRRWFDESVGRNCKNRAVKRWWRPCGHLHGL